MPIRSTKEPGPRNMPLVTRDYRVLGFRLLGVLGFRGFGFRRLRFT